MSIPEPTSYISRHEQFIEQQLLNVSASPSPELEQNNMNLNSTDTVSQGSSGSQYLQEVLGDVLVIRVPSKIWKKKKLS